MENYLSTLFTTAQIAGVFVGFGALISFTRAGDIAAKEHAIMSGMVRLGLTNVVVSLLPVALFHLKINDNLIWLISASTYLGILAFLYIQGYLFGTKLQRQEAAENLKSAPMITAMILDVPIILMLVSVLFGFFPSQQAGMYIAAVIIIILLECAVLLASLTWPNEDSEGPEK
jgi:hypothetical protein